MRSKEGFGSEEKLKNKESMRLEDDELRDVSGGTLIDDLLGTEMPKFEVDEVVVLKGYNYQRLGTVQEIRRSEKNRQWEYLVESVYVAMWIPQNQLQKRY